MKDSRGRNEVYRSLNFNLEKMFKEREELSSCYKSDARWDMHFDKEFMTREIMIKRAMESTTSDSKYCQANRSYLWSTIAESIFSDRIDNTIDFYSWRMRKTFAAPDFRKTMTVRPGKKKGKFAREVLNIDGCQMVIPNTFEQSKLKPDQAEQEKAAKARLVA